MNKISSRLLFSAVILTFTSGFFSCKKENKCTAGSGGALSMVVYLKHHGVTIPNDSLRPDTVWVLYNATEWKGAPVGYSARIIGEAGENHVHVPNLKCGDYYLYASGWDTSITKNVIGGIPVSTDKESGELEVSVPVSE